MRTAAMPETEVPGRELERFAGEGITGIRAGVAGPEQGINSEFFVGGELRLNQRR